MSDCHVIIPARLASTRLPRKPLADLGGKPLVVRVLERALASGARSVHVATDHDEIAAAVRGHGGDVIMTADDHRSGTDRLCEAAAGLGLDPDAVVVNLQGDEPLMPPACIRQVASLLARDASARMATLWRALHSREEWRNPNVVKLVADADERALYFSRAPIPHVRDGDWPADRARGHIGLYAYRAGALAEWRSLAPGRLEAVESLEQLRALEAGWIIACEQAVEMVPGGIDTPEDLQAAAERFRDSG